MTHTPQDIMQQAAEAAALVIERTVQAFASGGGAPDRHALREAVRAALDTPDIAMGDQILAEASGRWGAEEVQATYRRMLARRMSE